VRSEEKLSFKSALNFPSRPVRQPSVCSVLEAKFTVRSQKSPNLFFRIVSYFSPATSSIDPPVPLAMF